MRLQERQQATISTNSVENFYAMVSTTLRPLRQAKDRSNE
jgi:hypothetical protein